MKRLFLNVLGLFLYVVDPNFRRLVKNKRRRGADEAVAGGETVLAVLNSGNSNRRVIQ